MICKKSGNSDDKLLNSFKINALIFLLFSCMMILMISSAVDAALAVSLSNQGTDVRSKITGQLIYGNITIRVYDSQTGGSMIYGEDFLNKVSNGAWNAMLGANASNPLYLEYGKVYYLDYIINGENMNFTDFQGNPVDRQIFYSPLGDVNTAYIADGAITTAKIAVGAVNTSSIANSAVGEAQINPSTNLTIGQKITFALGGMLDNMANEWMRLTGNVNVTGGMDVNGRMNVNGNVDLKNGILNLSTPMDNMINLWSSAYSIGIRPSTLYMRTGQLLRIETSNSNASLNIFEVGNATSTYFAINGTNGNVGIGTSNPNQMLHVVGNVNVTGSVYSNALYPNAISTNILNVSGQTLLATSSGRVGIGTLTPGVKLDVVEPATSAAIRISSGNSHARFIANATSGSAASLVLQNNDLTLWQVAVNELLPGTDMLEVSDGNIPRLVIDRSTGNVGIGSINPAQRLTVVGDMNVTGTSYLGNVMINTENVTANNFISRDGNLTFFNNAGNERMRMLANGYIGIGTATPTYKLQVAGDVNLNNTFYVNQTTGNVGIGTTTPSAKLSILSNYTKKWIYLETSSGNPTIESASGLFLKSAGKNHYFSDADRVALGHVNDTTGYGDINIIGGNLGIGTSNPASKLNVIGDLNVTGTSYLGNVIINTENATLNNVISRNGNLSFFNNLMQQAAIITSSGYFGINSFNPAYLLEIGRIASGKDVNLSGTLYVNGTSGRVGINTPNPGQELNIIGDANITGNLYSGASYPASIVTGLLNVSGQTLLATSGGNVGIGTTIPSQKLEVFGNINLSASDPSIYMGAGYITHTGSNIIISD